MKATLMHDSGVKKKIKCGFSWTTLFFGFFVPLFRGDIKWAAIMFITGVALGSFTFGIGALIADIVFACTYNKSYTKDLLIKGYKPADEGSQTALSGYGVYAV